MSTKTSKMGVVYWKGIPIIEEIIQKYPPFQENSGDDNADIAGALKDKSLSEDIYRDNDEWKED